jgi:hypothetical protein
LPYIPRRKDYAVAERRLKWHGQDLPVVGEIVRIGGVETAVEIPELAEPELREIVALLAAFDRFEAAVSIALLELTAGLFIKHGGTPPKWRAYLGCRNPRPVSPRVSFSRSCDGPKAADVTPRVC